MTIRPTSKIAVLPENRLLTSKEVCRLQGFFPLDAEEELSFDKYSDRLLFDWAGNAMTVPVLMAKFLAAFVNCEAVGLERAQLVSNGSPRKHTSHP